MWDWSQSPNSGSMLGWWLQLEDVSCIYCKLLISHSAGICSFLSKWDHWLPFNTVSLILIPVSQLHRVSCETSWCTFYCDVSGDPNLECRHSDFFHIFILETLLQVCINLHCRLLKKIRRNLVFHSYPQRHFIVFPSVVFCSAKKLHNC